MDHHPPSTEIDPHALQESRTLWQHFTVMAKYGVIAVAVILIAMYAFLA